MNNLIYSEDELQKFINILPQLEKDELWFVSLSCRNKYLSDEERQIMGLSRTEMFAREFIYKTHIDNFNLNAKEIPFLQVGDEFGRINNIFYKNS